MRRWWRPSERWEGSGWRPHPPRFSKGNPVVGMGWFVDGIDKCAVHTPDDSRIAKWWLSFVDPSSISRSLTCFYLYRPSGDLFPIAAAGGGISQQKLRSLRFDKEIQRKRSIRTPQRCKRSIGHSVSEVYWAISTSSRCFEFRAMLSCSAHFF